MTFSEHIHIRRGEKGLWMPSPPQKNAVAYSLNVDRNETSIKILVFLPQTTLLYFVRVS